MPIRIARDPDVTDVDIREVAYRIENPDFGPRLSCSNRIASRPVSKGQSSARLRIASSDDLLPLHKEISAIMIADVPSSPMRIESVVDSTISMRVSTGAISSVVALHPGVILYLRGTIRRIVLRNLLLIRKRLSHKRIVSSPRLLRACLGELATPPFCYSGRRGYPPGRCGPAED